MLNYQRVFQFTNLTYGHHVKQLPAVVAFSERYWAADQLEVLGLGHPGLADSGT